MTFWLSHERLNVRLTSVVCQMKKSPCYRQNSPGNFALLFGQLYSAGNDMFKVNNRNIRTRCGICSKLIITTPERLHWRRSGVFIVNFEHISHFVRVFLLLTLSR